MRYYGYQWYSGPLGYSHSAGEPYAGSTNSPTLHLAAAQAHAMYTFWCEVTFEGGKVESTANWDVYPPQ